MAEWTVLYWMELVFLARVVLELIVWVSAVAVLVVIDSWGLVVIDSWWSVAMSIRLVSMGVIIGF